MRAARYSFATLWLLFMERKRPNQFLNQRIPSQHPNAHLQLHRVKRRILRSVPISVDRKAATEAPESRNCIKVLWSVSSSRCSRSLSLLCRVGCRTNTTALATCFAPVVLCRLPRTTRIILAKPAFRLDPPAFQDPPAQVRAPSVMKSVGQCQPITCRMPCIVTTGPSLISPPFAQQLQTPSGSAKASGLRSAMRLKCLRL